MTTVDGRKFFYVCPKCGRDVEGCPDPACDEENVGHHVDDPVTAAPTYPDDCDYDVPLRMCEKRFVPSDLKEE